MGSAVPSLPGRCWSSGATILKARRQTVFLYLFRVVMK